MDLKLLVCIWVGLCIYFGENCVILYVGGYCIECGGYYFIGIILVGLKIDDNWKVVFLYKMLEVCVG